MPPTLKANFSLETVELDAIALLVSRWVSKIKQVG